MDIKWYYTEDGLPNPDDNKIYLIATQKRTQPNICYHIARYYKDCELEYEPVWSVAYNTTLIQEEVVAYMDLPTLGTEQKGQDAECKKEKEKLKEVEKWYDELLYEIRHDEYMPMDEYCLRVRLAEVIDGYIAIQNRLVITLEEKREENDLMEESLKTLKWWQNRLYLRIKEMF